MLLPLVNIELVKSIKRLVSLTVAVLDRAGVLGGPMLLFMAAEIT
jgi:hypothetical protein